MSENPASAASGLFTPEEAAEIAIAIREHIDVTRRVVDPPRRTLLVDFFGLPKTMKTTITVILDQFFRRAGYHVFCPPETAEVVEVRSQTTDDPIVFQARHLTGDLNYVLNYSTDPRFHLVILSRGLIDMLYWYNRGRLEEKYSYEHVQSARSIIFQYLERDLVDAYFFLTATPETILEREYANALSQKRGRNMNEEALAGAGNIYREAIADAKENFPDLPIFAIDTTGRTPREVALEALQYLLPHLCQRFAVPQTKYLIRSDSLIRKAAAKLPTFEEQLKLRGHARKALINRENWALIGTDRITDTYLNLRPEVPPNGNGFEEIARIREFGCGKRTFLYKSQARSNIFSHRQPLSLDISEDDATELRRRYPTLATLAKKRKRYRRDGETPADHFFTLHLDTIADMGDFTEIRALGSPTATHTADLLTMATALGFKPAQIVEGSYLNLALRR